MPWVYPQVISRTSSSSTSPSTKSKRIRRKSSDDTYNLDSVQSLTSTHNIIDWYKSVARCPINSFTTIRLQHKRSLGKSKFPCRITVTFNSAGNYLADVSDDQLDDEDNVSISKSKSSVFETSAQQKKSKRKRVYCSVMIALSAGNKDKLESEWSYIKDELCPSIRQEMSNEDQPEKAFNWIVSHFNLLYAKASKNELEDMPRRNLLSNRSETMKEEFDKNIKKSNFSVISNHTNAVFHKISSTAAATITKPLTLFSHSKEDLCHSPKEEKKKVLVRRTSVSKSFKAVLDQFLRIFALKLGSKTKTFLSLILFNCIIAVVYLNNPLGTLFLILSFLNVFIIKYVLGELASSQSKPKITPEKTSPSNIKLEKHSLEKSKTEMISNEDEMELSPLPSIPSPTESENVFIDPQKKHSSSLIDHELDHSYSFFIPPGQTVVNTDLSSVDEEKRALYGEWKQFPSSDINVRIGPDYPINRFKAPSDEPIYETMFVDVYGSDKKLFHVGKQFDLALMGKAEPIGELETKTPENSVSASNTSEMFSLPDYLVFTVNCPLYAPSFLGNQDDGENFSVIFFARLSAAARSKIESQNPSPALELVRRFIDNPDPSFRSRLKGIGQVRNMSELSWGRVLGGLIQKYNSTPFLIRTKGDLRYDEHRVYSGKGKSLVTGAEFSYWEIDVDLHHFGSVCRNGFFYMKDILRKIRCQFGFVLEGQTNDELPEQLLVTAEMFGVENIRAVRYPLNH